MQDLNIGVIPENLRLAVAQSGLSASEVARRIGVTNTAMQQWFSGEKTPSTRNLALLAHVTNKPVGYFFGEDESGLTAQDREDAALGRKMRELLGVGPGQIGNRLGVMHAVGIS